MLRSFLLENYSGNTRKPLYTRDFFLCDMFLEPIKESDVIIRDKDIYILKSISMIGFLTRNFQIREKGCISPVGTSYYPIFSRQNSNNEFEVIDGINHLTIPFIKAPDHVVSKIIEMKLMMDY